MKGQNNPIKSFEPAKGISPDKFFDRIKAKHVIALIGAVALLIVSMGISSVSYKLHKEGADALDNHARVEEDTDLTYYLTVNEDGVDSSGTQSSDTVTANVKGGMTTVTDRIPDGLEFVGFVTTEDGTIGAAGRSDSSVACGGHVIDDTEEETVNAGTWNTDHTEYYYHGLHYNASTRTVSFRVENVQAGCGLTVGIITKTPTLGNNRRLDFYNTATLNEGILNLNSNTMHTWMGRNGLTDYSVTYSYTGTVPDNAPSAPEEQKYVDGANVAIAPSPIVEGYQFSGWTTSDTETELGHFTMPASNVAFTGSFTEKPAGTKYNVTYVIDGEAPENYVVPKAKQYEAGSMVKLDSTQKGHLMDKYVFSGWSTEDTRLDETGFVMPAKNVEIHGSFEERKYTVSYQFEGEVMPPNASALLPESQEYVPGTKVTRAPNPTADGYAFTGWYKNETFIMPEEDVVIYGEWSIQNGVFSPEISKTITNPMKKYGLGDTVKFEITVKNTAGYPIKDVQVLEQLDGAVFQQGSGYEIKSEGYALIPKLDAGQSIKLYAIYEVQSGDDQHLTNTAKIAGAIADNNYNLDTTKEYLATVEFDTALTGAPYDDGTDNANTLDKIAHYAVLGLVAIAGAIASFFMIRRTLKNGQLQALVPKAKTGLQGLKNIFNPNTATRGRLIAFATADLALVAVAAGLIVKLNLPQKLAENADPTTISFMSSSADYDAGEGGAWKITKSAKWTGDGKAQLTIDVDTVAKNANGRYTDVLFVVDVSGSMDGAKIDRVKQDMTELTDSLLSNGQNQVAMVSFESGAKKELDFTTDKTAAQTAIDNLGTSGCTNYYQAFKEAEGVLKNYQVQDNRDLFLLFLTDGYPNEDTPNERAEYAYLKSAYPTMVINAIQYEMAAEILDPIKAISDNQYIANMDTLNNVLFEASRAPYFYESFDVEDIIDTRYFEADSGTTVEALNPSLGTAELTDENGQQKIKWNMDGLLRSGSSAKLTINLKLKDQYKRIAGEYPTNSNISATSTIPEGRTENENNNETPILKNTYNVYYEANSPSDCTVANMPSSPETHFVYETVEMDPTVPTCAGYNFKGFVATETGIRQMNDDYFTMPEKDVTFRAIWTKASIQKVMDGTVHEAAVATLKMGENLNKQMKQLSGQTSASYTTANTSITAIKEASELPTNISTSSSGNIISIPNSAMPVYAWFENGTIYYYSLADTIALNSTSSNLLANMRNLADINALSTWDSSKVVNMSSAFYWTSINNVDALTDWDVSNVTNMQGLFQADSSLASIEGLANWDVSIVRNMKNLFNGTKATNIDALSSWDTPSVTDMSNMFSSASSLTNIDGASNWDTSNVTNMSFMFYNASSLTNIDGASNWDTSNVTNMSSMFYNATSLTNIDGLSNWDTSSVTSMSGMFSCATSLINIDALSNWDTSSVTSMGSMFACTTSLTNIDGASNWDTSNVTNMSSMFYNAASLTNIDALSNWDTSSVASMSSMFRSAYSLTNINGATNWNTSSVTNTNEMFNNAIGLTNIDGASNWNTSSVTNMKSMFSGARELTEINALANWDTSMVTDIGLMFYDVRKITNTNALQNWNTSNVVSMASTFMSTSDLTDINALANWDTSKVTSMASMFLQASSLADIDALSSWDTSEVMNMSQMFEATNLTNTDALLGWDTSKVKNMSEMFARDTSLTNIDALSYWNTSKVENTNKMFLNDASITSLSPLNSWNTSSLTSKNNMFDGIPSSVARPTWY